MPICLNTFVADWLASPTSVTVGHNRFAGGENINLLCVSCSGPSVKKPWRETQEATALFSWLECPKCRGGGGLGSL